MAATRTARHGLKHDKSSASENVGTDAFVRPASKASVCAACYLRDPLSAAQPLVVSSSPMLGNRTSEQWIAQYSRSHQHPVNRL